MSLLFQQIEQMSREKGVDAGVIIAAVEDAILTAAKKYYGTEEPYQARFNEESGQVEVFLVKTVVDSVVDPETEITVKDAKRVMKSAALGSKVELHKSTEALGRIAAQTAKQVIFQKVREAERDHIFAEYGDRVGQLVTGIVKRAESGDLMMDLGKTEAVLPRREQSRAEVFNPGERVRVVITRVSRTARGPQVIVSRTDPSLLARLFEMEVPEIYEGTVVVKNAVREPGDRAKVAVYSREKDVDPVGACVGLKGARVQNIIRELRGEKIDIVEWDDDVRSFAINALNPAKVSRVSIVDDKERSWKSSSRTSSCRSRLASADRTFAWRPGSWGGASISRVRKKRSWKYNHKWTPRCHRCGKPISKYSTASAKRHCTSFAPMGSPRSSAWLRRRPMSPGFPESAKRPRRSSSTRHGLISSR